MTSFAGPCSLTFTMAQLNDFASFTASIAAKPEEFFFSARPDVAGKIKEHLKKIADAGESFVVFHLTEAGLFARY